MDTTVSLEEVLRGVEYNFRRGGSAALKRRLRGISDDSRTIRQGELFLALRGRSGEPRRHVEEALARGCRILAVDHDVAAKISVPPRTVVLELSDPRAALGRLAANLHGNPAGSLSLVGITGTNGKTTTTYLLEGTLAAAGYRVGVLGTVSYRYPLRNGGVAEVPAGHTTPGPLLLHQVLSYMVAEGVTHVVMEVSSHALDQQRVAGLLFDVAVFTNLSRDHLDYHRTWEDYFASKTLLFTRYLRPGGTAVVLAGVVPDDPAQAPEERNWGERLARLLRKQHVRPWGSRATGSGLLLLCGGDRGWLRATGVWQDHQGLRCLLRAGRRTMPLNSTLVGRHNLENLLCAAGAALACGLTPAQACQGLATVRQIPGRLEQVRRPSGQQVPAQGGGPVVYVDYAHSPAALAHVLTTLRELPHRRLICVFGCGGERDQGKRPQMGEVASRLADRIVLTSDNPRGEEPLDILAAIEAGIRREDCPRQELARLFRAYDGRGYAVAADRRQAIRAAISLAAPEDLVLVAGKGHESSQRTKTSVIPFDDRLEAASALIHWRPDRVRAATGGAAAGERAEDQSVERLSPPLSGRISTDSRSVRPGDIFVALRGDRFDGHDYLAAAAAAGAALLVAEHPVVGLPPAVELLIVRDSLVALGDLAVYRRRLLGDEFCRIALTGSSGKTTVKEMCAAICALHCGRTSTGQERVLKTQGNFNNLIGLPLTLLQAEPWHRLAVLELGMNRPGEIARLTEIADPDIACINNVQPAHLLGLGSVEGVARAKGELFQGVRDDARLVVNLDDPHVRQLARRQRQPQVGFALDPRHRRKALVRASRLKSLGAAGSRFTLHVGTWQGRCTLPLPGRHNVMNALAAAALAHCAGVEPELTVAALADYRPVDKRMQAQLLAAGPSLLNDAYNANPASMRAALETVAGFGGGCKVALLGDMLELGPSAEAAHREIGTRAARLGYDFLAALGEFAPVMVEAARRAGMASGQLLCCSDHGAMAAWVQALVADSRLGVGDWILLKGSRGMRMERLLDFLPPAGDTATPRQG